MSSVEKKIVGVEQGVNKKYNTPFTVLHTVSIFDDYAIDNRGARGSKCESTYIRAHVACDLGDVVSFVYSPGFNNEAVVSDVNVLNKSK